LSLRRVWRIRGITEFLRISRRFDKVMQFRRPNTIPVSLCTRTYDTQRYLAVVKLITENRIKLLVALPLAVLWELNREISAVRSFLHAIYFRRSI